MEGKKGLTVADRRLLWQERVHPKQRVFVRHFCPSRRWWVFRRIDVMTRRAFDKIADNFFAPTPLWRKLKG